MSREIRSVDFEPLEETNNRVAFRIVYHGDPPLAAIRETYELTRSSLEMRCEIDGTPDAICFQVPLIETDGSHRSRIESDGRSFRVAYQGHIYRIRCRTPGSAEARLEEFSAPNRNAVYRVGVFTAKGNTLTCRLSIE
jgi:hypothetical protein